MFRLRGFQTLTLISFATRSSSLRTSTRGYMHVILFFVHSLLDEQIKILFLPLQPYFFVYPSMFRYHKSVWKFVITTNEEFVYKDYKHNQLNSFEMNQQALRFSSDQSQATPCSFSVSLLHNLQLTFFFFLPHCKTRRDPCQYSSISDLILRLLETWEKLGWILP